MVNHRKTIVALVGLGLLAWRPEIAQPVAYIVAAYMGGNGIEHLGRALHARNGGGRGTQPLGRAEPHNLETIGPKEGE